MMSLPLIRFSFSPVKGTRHTAQVRAGLSAGGIEHNRRWGLVQPKAKRVLRSAAYPQLMQIETLLEDGAGFVNLTLKVPGRGHFTVEPLEETETAPFDFWGQSKQLAVYQHPINTALTDFLGEEVALAYATDSLIFSQPLSLIGTASLKEISRRAGQTVEPARFRANLLVETEVPFVEDSWGGQTITLQASGGVPAELDGVVLTIGEPVGRCAVINAHPVTGVRDLPLLKSLASYRPRNHRNEPVAGVYAALAGE